MASRGLQRPSALLTVTVVIEGHYAQLTLEPEEQETWLSCFRSLFGPKQAMVDELRAERRLMDASVVVAYDNVRHTFYPDGRIRTDTDRWQR